MRGHAAPWHSAHRVYLKYSRVVGNRSIVTALCTYLYIYLVTIAMQNINWHYLSILMQAVELTPISTVPLGSPSRGYDVVPVCVFDINQSSLPTPILFLVCLCLYGPFHRISFHKFSWQLSAFSLSSSGLISSILALSTIYNFMKVSLSLDIILCGWLGLKH